MVCPKSFQETFFQNFFLFYWWVFHRFENITTTKNMKSEKMDRTRKCRKKSSDKKNRIGALKWNSRVSLKKIKFEKIQIRPKFFRTKFFIPLIRKKWGFDLTWCKKLLGCDGLRIIYWNNNKCRLIEIHLDLFFHWQK